MCIVPFNVVRVVRGGSLFVQLSPRLSLPLYRAARCRDVARRDPSQRQLRQRVRRVLTQQVSVVPLNHLQAGPRELSDGKGVQLVQRD
jgi:hypothetical protein